jgi:hypothetical protein
MQTCGKPLHLESVKDYSEVTPCSMLGLTDGLETSGSMTRQTSAPYAPVRPGKTF